MLRSLRALVCALLAFALLPTAQPSAARAQSAPAKKTVTSETDLPRFSYPVTGSASDLLLSDDATFAPFAQKVGADVDSVLSGYDIQDKSTLRTLLRTKLNVQVLSRDSAGASSTLDQLRDVEEKPEAKLLAGFTLRTILRAQKDAGATSGPAYQAAFAKEIAERLNALPWAPVQEGVKHTKFSYQILTPDLLVSSLKVHGDPEALKSKTIDLPIASQLVDYRVAIQIELPVKNQIVSAVSAYIDAHNVQKPDIWVAREVTLSSGQKLAPVRVAVLDGGLDPTLFPTSSTPTQPPAITVLTASPTPSKARSTPPISSNSPTNRNRFTPRCSLSKKASATCKAISTRPPPPAQGNTSPLRRPISSRPS